MVDQINKPATEPPPDWALDMAKLDYNPMADRAAYNIATSGPTSALPREARVSTPPRSSSSVGKPIQPPPGIDWVDKICIAADQRERAQAAAPDMMAQMAQAMMMMMMMMQQQSTMIALLAQIVTNQEPATAKPDKPKAGGSK
jgi:hypothetical protein